MFFRSIRPYVYVKEDLHLIKALVTVVVVVVAIVVVVVVVFVVVVVVFVVVVADLFHVIVLPICSLIWCYILEPYCS